MMQRLLENLQRLEALYDLYDELSKKAYSTKEEIEIAKLKMILIKKEMLLLSLMINKNLEVQNA